jgi:hypothetical protein
MATLPGGEVNLVNRALLRNAQLGFREVVKNEV